MNKTFSAALGLACAVLGCVPVAPAAGSFDPDLVPPVLVRAAASGPHRILLEFDEPPTLMDPAVSIIPELAVAGHAVQENTIELSTAAAQSAGREYALRLTVADAAGNSAWLIVSFYGFNPSPPRLLVNEFITRGTSAHPDLVEIKAVAGGNMGGVTLYCGTASIWKHRFVFPPFPVSRGDFIVLHLKPQGLPEEIDETSSPAASGGLDASPSAYDFWLRDGTGLSGNNGAISLYDMPQGTLLDAVLYSTRSSDSDADYRGFGSADIMAQADELAAAGGWTAAGQLIAPEDAVNPDPSTTTRSLCRSSDARDTNGKADWHIVPTRGASFGRENSDEVYAP